jgi:hypothetical protein
MKAWIVTLLATAGLAVTAAGSAADITVMTQNQYLGADIAPLVEPGIPPEVFFARVVEALQQASANRPTERFEALAAEITDSRAHLVGMQEVFSFECEDITGGGGCSSPLIAGAMNDHLQGTMAALGDSYRVVAQVKNLDVELPLFLSPTVGVLIHVVDRDVILARKDVGAQPLPPEVVAASCPRPSMDGCNFSVVIPLGPPLNVNIERGYVAATALVNGRPYLFVNTHLETREPAAFVQALQGLELLQVVGALKEGLGMPAIVVGDMNSSPNDPAFVEVPPLDPRFPPFAPTPYAAFSSAMQDAWLLRPGTVPGLSCCQAADLSNHNSQVYERIDLVWSSEVPWKVKDARVLGETVNFKTHPHGRGLWPSDHGAVTATLQFR